MASLIVLPARTLQGTLTVPGDKSISHRAVLIGALAEGTTRITGCLGSDDVRRSRSAIEALGVRVREEGTGLVVEGRGPEGFRAPAVPLDAGNSGTTARLLLGILAGCPFRTLLIGDESLSKRPMRRVTEPLQKMGAVIASGPTGPRNDAMDHLPLTIRGGRLRGIEHTLTVPSAQVKSALLLAGLAAEGSTTVVEPVPTRDHTERMLRHFGAKIEIASAPAGPRNDVIASEAKQSRMITIEPGPLTARELTVPGDFSSAAFFLVAAAIVPGSRVTVRDVGLNPTRTGLLDLLRRMGAGIEITPENWGHNEYCVPKWEPVGDVTVSYAPLRGITVEPEIVPNVIDELPALMVAATQAEGRTRLEGVGELRVKETDRIRSMVEGLSSMGARVRAERESVIVEGPARLKGAAVDSCGDHRTAMALAVAGLTAEGRTTLRGAEWVSISFPSFAESIAAIRG